MTGHTGGERGEFHLHYRQSGLWVAAGFRLIGVVSVLNTINDSSFSSSPDLIVGDNYCLGPHLHK